MTRTKSKACILVGIACIGCLSLEFWRNLPRVASFGLHGRVARNAGLDSRDVFDGSNPSAIFHGSKTTQLAASVDKDGDAVATRGNNEKDGFFWNFRGHSCYARVDTPTEDSEKGGDSNKPIILLIHGFACSTVYWRETRACLTRAGYTVHSVDLLGQGRSSKPGRTDGVEYSIDLWAKMVDDYARRYMDLGDDNEKDVVLVGNSLGSTVALSATSGDCYQNDEAGLKEAFLPSRVKALCFFNCGVGLNTRNALKAVESEWLKTLLNLLFDTLNLLVFNNRALLTYVLDEQVSKETLRNALLGLYPNADDPEAKVDDELVDSFLDPVAKDATPAVVEVLSQIYTNDAGRTPMEMHQKHNALNEIPIHLIWGDQDPIAPVVGDVGTFYSKLAATSGSKISLQLIQDAGHIPFDEKPECNVGMIEWLADTFKTVEE